MTKTSIFITALLLISTAHLQAQDELKLYLWEDSLSPKIQAKIEKAYDTQLQLHYLDNDDERNKLMLNSRSLPFDIVVFDNVSANIYGEQGELVNLKDLPNRRHNEPRWDKVCGQYAVPYFWGTLGLVYRESKFSVPPSSWNQLLYPSDEIKGHIGLLEDSVETLIPALFSLGYSSHTSEPSELKEAFNILKSIQSNVLTYEYPISYVRSHPDSDDLHLAMAYSGDQYSLNQYLNEKDWKYVVPNEGTYIWVDCLAVSAHSKQTELAKKILNELMEPITAAANANEVMVATPNKSAMDLLPISYITDKTLFPSQEIIEKSVIDSDMSVNNINLRAKIINNIVTSHEAKY
ncbi:spermidine/putrescine ABC transporter substrate-binding protein [Vibrio makurazakiensis]|uniref:polyamine ABC transporter substrate-binding protein n=1 Tax=Vibrio makurazakiensis TaxID=2910250 RepID=UPI003D0F601B